MDQRASAFRYFGIENEKVRQQSFGNYHGLIEELKDTPATVQAFFLRVAKLSKILRLELKAGSEP